jgi:glycosyltransferase involved in cell wall biosynthesis
VNENKPPVLGMILKGYPRISETFISNEILLLEKLGFSIHLFSMRRPRENFSHESVNHVKASVDYLPETLLVPLPKLLYHNFLLAQKRPGTYKIAVKTALRRFSRTRKSATIKHLLQAGYLVQRLLPDSGVKHLHAHFAHSPTSVAMFAGQLSGLPFSFTAHAKDIYTSDPRQLKEKMAFARFVVTCTEYNKRHLLAILNKKPALIHRIYHGIDTDLFSWDQKEKKTTPPYRILTVARLTAKKGLSTVYRAIRQLYDQGFDVHHTLIGDGEDRRKILSLIKALGLDHITSCLGSQPHEVVLNHYRQADLFVLGCEIAPNGDRDGIPNVFLECMAMGVPVVSTRVSAIPEVIKDGKTGLLVPPGRPGEMARAMARMLTDKELKNRIVTDAQRYIASDFNNKKLINHLADLFRSAGL